MNKAAEIVIGLDSMKNCCFLTDQNSRIDRSVLKDIPEKNHRVRYMGYYYMNDYYYDYICFHRRRYSVSGGQLNEEEAQNK